MFRPPLSVLHVNSAREYRGGQNQVRLLMTGLEERGGVRQALVAGRGSRLLEQARTAGVETRPVPWRRAAEPRALHTLRAALAEAWDVVHAHDGHAVQAALLAGALAGTESPVVAARRVAFRSRSPRVWQGADLVVAISRRVRDVMLEQGLDRRRVVVVASGIDPRAVAPAAGAAGPRGLRAAGGAASEELLVAAVGALTPNKDHATFVRAAAEVASDFPGTRFAVFGDGPERDRLARLVRESGLDGRFRLPGEFPDASRALTGIDVFVMSSRSEGLGTACIEAMLARRPIVATGAGGLRELAAGGAFRPVPPRDPDAMAAELRRLLASSEERRRAGEAAARGALEFTADRMVAGTLRCYRAVARHR